MVEYDRLRTLLRRELGVEPLPETEEAVKHLMQGDGTRERSRRGASQTARTNWDT